MKDKQRVANKKNTAETVFALSNLKVRVTHCYGNNGSPVWCAVGWNPAFSIKRAKEACIPS